LVKQGREKGLFMFSTNILLLRSNRKKQLVLQKLKKHSLYGTSKNSFLLQNQFLEVSIKNKKLTQLRESFSLV